MQEWTCWFDSNSDGENRKEETLVLKVQSIPFLYISSGGNRTCSSAAGSPQHTNVAEEAIHFWLMGYSGEEVLA